MGEEQRQALARLIAENQEFKAAISGAASVEDAVRIAGDHGIEAGVEDFGLPEGSLSDAELENVSGGAVSWGDIYCGGGPPGSWGVISCSG